MMRQARWPVAVGLMAALAGPGAPAWAGVSPRDYQRLIEQLSEAHKSDKGSLKNN